MRPTRHKFQPQLVEGLEERKMLSRGVGPVSAVTDTLDGRPEKHNKGKAASIVSLVNASFATFQRDYAASRGVYFSAIQARTAPIGSDTGDMPDDPAGDLGAIRQYTRQRVNLLAQQLRNNFQQSSLYTKQDKHDKSNPLAIIEKKINAKASENAAKNPFDDGTLGRALYQSIPSPTASPTAVALNSLAQDNAIEAARIAVINGINTIKVQASRRH